MILGAESDRFLDMRKVMIKRLLDTEPIHPTHWQKLDVSQSDAHATYEMMQVTIYYDMPQTMAEAQKSIRPDLPWAEGHFRERIAGEAVNPGAWHDKWPYHAGEVTLHQNGGKYDHNYMERIWPTDVVSEFAIGGEFWGYRFPVGDLRDVVNMLINEPTTRQAYLPIWFPEDTGATSGQRVPCSLGYHFIIRDGALHLTYNLRSCEAYRHFTNDVYMAVRLAQEVAREVNEELDMGLSLGTLHMTVASLHGFVGDTDRLEALCHA